MPFWFILRSSSPRRFAELLLVDHPEAAIDERLLEALGLDRDFAVHQQVALLQLLHERRGALAGRLELLAELQDGLGRLARLVAVEQRLAVVEIADRAGRRIEAERQLVAVRAQPGEQERIAAQIGRDVDVRVDRRGRPSSRKTLMPSLRPISAIGTGLSPTEKTIG